jgi:hypothetical protein
MTISGALANPATAQGPYDVRATNSVRSLIAVAVANPAKVHATKAALRDLWIGHVFWVRNVVVAELAGNGPARQLAEKQVVANAQSIAAAIEPFYGTAARKQLFELLAGHYGAIKAYLEASVAKKDSELANATAKLTSNAGEIARFLSGANPHLPKDTLEGLLLAHGGHHIAQIQQLQSKDYIAEAGTWADMSQHMYVVADALADALAKQFPAKF